MIGWTNARCVVIFFWLLAAVLGGFHAWASRYSMNPDGIVYLDMADAYLGRDWGTALISYRSPLYPWILGLAMVLSRLAPLCVAWRSISCRLLDQSDLLAPGHRIHSSESCPCWQSQSSPTEDRSKLGCFCCLGTSLRDCAVRNEETPDARRLR